VGQYQEIPLFPLNTVLFPGMTLPLHIFEPRYKLMIGECIQSARPFGVVMIRSGSEVGGDPRFYNIGTTASITQVERLGDGRMNIATLGLNRFRLRSVHQKKIYLSGVAEDFPLAESQHPAVEPLAQQLGARLQDYLQLFATLGKVQIAIDTLPQSPTTLAFLTAIVLRMPMQDKQTLLNVPDLLTLLRVENRMLWRETELLKIMINDGPKMRDDPSPFSTN